jgi:ectoine hydroxylase-related dioxygenase (phytanoyl-CoA dioxygenase family)
MIDWHQSLAASTALGPGAAVELLERGFVVLPDAVAPDRLERLRAAYTHAMDSATGADIRVGTTSTRVTDFVNRGPEFDEIYVFPPLLQACALVIGGPFKLSSLQARTLRAGSPSQGLHVDVDRQSADWPLLGFILMVDEFRPDNGATRFVPGSHRRVDIRAGEIPDAPLADVRDLPACGAAGSLLVFNGSTWHGHGTNTSSEPRRSLQGAYIPRTGRAGSDFAARMEPTTRARLGPLAQYLLAL